MSLNLSTLLARARLAVSDEARTGVTQEYSDANLSIFVAEAVEVYSDYNPHRMAASLTTVAQQEYYALPSDCVRLLRVQWYTTFAPLFPNQAPFYFYDYNDPSLVYVRDQLMKNFNEITRTSWAEVNYPYSYMNGRYLRLFPMPTNAGDQVLISYEGLHPLNALGTAYDTIPDRHMDILVKLTEARVYRRRASRLTSSPDLQAGQTIRTGSKPAQILIMMAYRLEEEALAEFNGPAAGRS